MCFLDQRRGLSTGTASSERRSRGATHAPSSEIPGALLRLCLQPFSAECRACESRPKRTHTHTLPLAKFGKRQTIGKSSRDPNNLIMSGAVHGSQSLRVLFSNGLPNISGGILVTAQARRKHTARTCVQSARRRCRHRADRARHFQRGGRALGDAVGLCDAATERVRGAAAAAAVGARVAAAAAAGADHRRVLRRAVAPRRTAALRLPAAPVPLVGVSVAAVAAAALVDRGCCLRRRGCCLRCSDGCCSWRRSSTRSSPRCRAAATVPRQQHARRLSSSAPALCTPAARRCERCS